MGNNLTYSQLFPALSNMESWKDTNFTYNTNNKLTSYTQIFWNPNNSSWQPVLKEVYTYDANNNLTSETEQGWNGTTFINWTHILYT